MRKGMQLKEKSVDNRANERYTEENKSAKADTKGEMNYEIFKRGNCSVTE